MGGAERLRLQILGGIGATEACGRRENDKINDTAEKGRERQQGNKHSNAILADMSTRFASCFLTRLTNEQTACAVISTAFQSHSQAKTKHL
jgi:hypothetical protein